MRRLPIIRHIRWLVLTYKVNRHYDMWLKLGYLPVHSQSDYDHLDKIWRGEA